MEKHIHRDLMIILREAYTAPEEMEAETKWLHALLNRVEVPQNIALNCEVINLVRYKIERKYDRVLTEILSPKERPFVFVFVKN